MKLRARLNNLTMCIFHSDNEIKIEDIQTIVDNVNNGIQSELELLKRSIV